MHNETTTGLYCTESEADITGIYRPRPTGPPQHATLLDITDYRLSETRSVFANVMYSSSTTGRSIDSRKWEERDARTDRRTNRQCNAQCVRWFLAKISYSVVNKSPASRLFGSFYFRLKHINNL